MNRLAIRNYARFLLDELSELPEGQVKDEDDDIFDLNEVINISQQNVQLDLIPIIPQYFRKKFLISREINKWEYDIEDDLSVTDFLMMEDIFHNLGAKKPHGLTYIELDQLYEFVGSINEVAEPKVWFWEEEGVIGLRPIPPSTLADRYKAYYFYKVPDLNHDTSDTSPNIATPPFPAPAHKLISIDAVFQCQIADESGAIEVGKIYDRELSRVRDKLLKIKPSLKYNRRGRLSEAVR
jgi:hypothetical protein